MCARLSWERFNTFRNPFELYDAIRQRELQNPSFLQRSLHYIIEAKRNKRIQLTVSISRRKNTGCSDQNIFPIYVLLAPPTSSISLEGQPPIYRFSRAYSLTSFTTFGNKDHTKATFIIPDSKNLESSRACNLNIILISREGQVGGSIGENNCAVEHLERSALQELEGKCFWGKIPINLLSSSLKNSVTLSLGHTVEFPFMVEMRASFLQPKFPEQDNFSSFNSHKVDSSGPYKFPEQDNCYTVLSHLVDATGSYKLQVGISAQEAGARDIRENPYSSNYAYNGVPPPFLPDLIRFRAGNVFFNYKYLNNTMQETEVTEDFACSFCRVKCGSYKGLLCHLNSSHDLFHSEFSISEEFQAVNVSLKTDDWRMKFWASVEPIDREFSYCSRFKTRRLATTAEKISLDDDISVECASSDPTHSSSTV